MGWCLSVRSVISNYELFAFEGACRNLRKSQQDLASSRNGRKVLAGEISTWLSSRRTKLMQKTKECDNGKSEFWFRLATQKFADKLCVGCESRTGREFEWTQQPVCKECRRTRKQFQVMTKTNAIKHYRLKETHLDELEFVETRNPRYRSAAPMKLYWRPEVRVLAEKVHGSKKTRLALVAKSQERMIRMRQKKLDSNKEERRMMSELDK